MFLFISDTISCTLKQNMGGWGGTNQLGNKDKWLEKKRTKQNNPHKCYIQFDLAHVYLSVLFGRSNKMFFSFKMYEEKRRRKKIIEIKLKIQTKSTVLFICNSWFKLFNIIYSSYIYYVVVWRMAQRIFHKIYSLWFCVYILYHI